MQRVCIEYRRWKQKSCHFEKEVSSPINNISLLAMQRVCIEDGCRKAAILKKKYHVLSTLSLYWPSREYPSKMEVEKLPF